MRIIFSPNFENSSLDTGISSMIQVITGEEPDLNEEEPSIQPLYLLPTRHFVLYPGIISPISLKKPSLIQRLQKLYDEEKPIGLIAQKNDNTPAKPKDLYSIGTKAKLLKVVTFPDGTKTFILQGKQKFKVKTANIGEGDVIHAEVSLLKDQSVNPNKKEVKALVKSIKETAMRIVGQHSESPSELTTLLQTIQSPTFLTYFLSAHINADLKYKQRLLSMSDTVERGTSLLKHLLKEAEINELKQKIEEKVHTDLNQQQRNYYLKQQIKVLQNELSEADEEGSDEDIALFRTKGKKKKWPLEVAEHFEKTLQKFERMPQQSSEYTLLFNYIETLLDLPWNTHTKDDFDLKRAQSILDKDHFGMEKVKERILEYLAVRKLKEDMKGPILCFYGPPGVGKTSLGSSIAKTLKREFVRLSLGGLHDEAEIRGHRKTYVGALPGKIIQYISKAKTSNPVFILDEIDKIGQDFKGDPTSALLEVLDPEQNTSFVDNFLEVPFDLSQVLFIATANNIDSIPHALYDRMEMIEITGYSLEEKVKIAQKYLVPNQLQEHGITSKDLQIPVKSLSYLIDGYTSESGVRELKRKIGTLARKAAKSIVLNEDYIHKIQKNDLHKILGAPDFLSEKYQTFTKPGIAVGLAWTAVGGEILLIETALAKGKGKLTLSGQLGDIMQESALTALSYLKTNAQSFGIDPQLFDQYDLHIHLPEGAVPKDGPSAGITLLTALASLCLQKKVKKRLAMSGELTLHGRVLPVGGLKEKLLAAARAGIQEIILSKKNEKNVLEIKPEYLKDLTIHYLENAQDVLKLALEQQKVKQAINWQIENESKESN